MGAASVCACARARAEEALSARGAPPVPDSDQGTVFSSAAREGPLASGRARRSTDGEARRAGSAIAERRPRSLGTECARISEHGAPAGLRGLIAAYAEQHDDARPRRSLGHGTPAERYYPGLMAA